MLDALVDALIFGLLGLAKNSSWGQAVHYFVSDTILIGGLLVASGFGAVTPFCSCSSIPLFVGFLQGGIPLGVTLSFLITSPLVNEVALALFIGLFGWGVTLIYAGGGILLGTVLGWGLGKFGLGAWVEDWVWDIAQGQAEEDGTEQRSLWEQWPSISREAMDIVSGVAPYAGAGLVVGAGIHGFVPVGRRLSRGTRLRGGGRTRVRQCRWGAAHRRVASDEGDSAGHGTGLHDGRGGTIAAGGDDAQKGDANAPAGDLLRGGGRVDRGARVRVQLGAVTHRPPANRLLLHRVPPF